ncbi:MAG TPA: hypothetical protein VFN49_13160 [Candidatus Aquilonibacter sp.]|nr:hypothetical protein [Candidatus Aquilonibacter sp.]
MFNEIKGLVEQKIQEAGTQNVTAAAKDSIGNMPPGEVTQHAQTAVTNLNDQGQGDLAKELQDVMQAAQDNPVGLKNAVIGFVEHHPETLAAFAPGLARDILGKV